jgi:hypothetical protein
VSPYLSVVTVSRNDDHGGDPLFRTQVFVDSLAEQCERFKVVTELVLVDWNPPQDRCGLRDAIRWPKKSDFFVVRVIEVPPSVHRSIRGSAALPLFQMIGKNVGIRRAVGQFVLATNIDIVFSDELFAVFSDDVLREGCLYRCDRYDSQSGVPHPASHAVRQEYLAAHCIRKNRRFGPLSLARLGENAAAISFRDLQEDPYIEAVAMSRSVPIVTMSRECPAEYLHTNGCGDFTLMSNTDWHRLRGYAEFEAFSFHIDSLLVYAAHYSGILETSLLAPAVAYHLEHSSGSGWTPEGAEKLFDRIERLGLPSMPYPLLLWILTKSRNGGGVMTFNREDWGMASLSFREFDVKIDSMVEKTHFRPLSREVAGPVAAVRDEWQYYKVYSEFLLEELAALRLGSPQKSLKFGGQYWSAGILFLWRQRQELMHRAVGLSTAYLSFVLRSNFPSLMKYLDRFRSRKI